MVELNFDELKEKIRFELLYPNWALVTKKEASEYLGVSIYSINKLVKEYKLTGNKSHGTIFFYKSEINDFKEGIFKSEGSSSDRPFDELEKHIRYKLFYPDDKLLTLKTAPAFLKTSKYVFNLLRRNHEFMEYDHQGMKFFSREELERHIFRKK
jgi:hypothetical protein